MLRFVECSDESEEYDEYDSEESNENEEYDSDESYYYSSDSYEEYPQSNVLNESNSKNREGEKEKGFVSVRRKEKVDGRKRS